MQVLKAPAMGQVARTHRRFPNSAMPSASSRPLRRPLMAMAATEAMEDIDPMTGMPIPKFSATNPIAGLKVNVKGVQWAYRRSDVDSAKASPDKPAVLLLHGLGSSSYSYRNTLGLLGADGYNAIAPDWPGHGDSDKPSSFNYTEDSFISALDDFVASVGIQTPVALVVQGFVLSQYALLWALKNESKIARVLILNTPLALNSKLRPELAAYKAPLAFMRPKNFDGMMFNAAGSAYVMERLTADAYARPFLESPAASQAVATTMDKVDFKQLLSKVDSGFKTWRKPTLLLFGGSDPFVGVSSAFDFLEDKRTNIKTLSPGVKIGHCPQEDFAEAVHETMLLWLTGQSDQGVLQSQKLMKMTKKGGVEI